MGADRTDMRSLPMNPQPLIIIFSALVIIGLIWAALRLTIKRDRATIAADMDDPEDIETYNEAWRSEK
jgi:hypothetical protein